MDLGYKSSFVNDTTLYTLSGRIAVIVNDSGLLLRTE